MAAPSAPSAPAPVAAAREIGRFTFTAAEITRFATAFDPQPAHLAGPHNAGVPVASGWHVVCAWMGFFVRSHEGAQAEALPGDHPAMISPVGVGFGLKDLKWLEPVPAGTRLVFFTAVEEARPSGSRPGWQILRRCNSARTEAGQLVMSFTLSHLAPMVSAEISEP